MSKHAEPQGFADYREYEPAYKDALENAGFTTATLDFSFFKVLTELPDHQKISVADIAWPGLCAIEVKKPDDLGGSCRSGRLFWQIWDMYLLKLAGVIRGFAVLVRDVANPPTDERAVASYLDARQMLAKYQERFGVKMLVAYDPADVVDVAKSFMRECWQPKKPEMPPPYIPETMLVYSPLTIQIAASCNGYAKIRSAELAADYSPAEFWSEALADDVNSEDEFQAFKDKFSARYGIGEVLLREVWRRANQKSQKAQPPEDYFIRRVPGDVKQP